MKTKLTLLLCLPLIAVAAPPYRHGGPGAAMSRGKGQQNCPNQGVCPMQLGTLTSPTTLSPSEVVAAIEEERLARDLYLAAADLWKLRVFSNIAAAELRHETALLQLAASAGIPVPARQTGVYASPDVQRLWADLLPLVTQSETGALRAAALVEETDIADLRRMRALATDEGTRAVLSNLERASGFHLRAFVRNLEARGVTYQPQVLTPDEFNAAMRG
jgi:hypothetical protein